MSLLVIDNLEAGFGEITALHGIQITVEPGEVVTIIGSNGAGKTTLLRTISGLVKARSGRIVFAGRDIAAAPRTRSFAQASCRPRKGA
jgi:branched-chain amino acid transport system ATP-binding protein